MTEVYRITELVNAEFVTLSVHSTAEEEQWLILKDKLTTD